MSGSLRSVGSSLKRIKPTNGSRLICPNISLESRRCIHSLRTQSTSTRWNGNGNMQVYRVQKRDMHALAQKADEYTGAQVVEREEVEEDFANLEPEQDFTEFKQHLEGLFPPLQFPPELAKRVLTHASHPASSYGHNAGYTFMGRRVLESYLLLFLNSAPNLSARHDLEDITARAINTYTLGKHIGSRWGMGRVVRWVPTLPKPFVDKADMGSKKPFGALSKRAGLYKIQGDAVAAVMGAIFQQFGGAVAHRVFHTRILPHLVGLGSHEGLDGDFTSHARKVCASLGGSQGEMDFPTLQPRVHIELGSAPEQQQEQKKVAVMV